MTDEKLVQARITATSDRFLKLFSVLLFGIIVAAVTIAVASGGETFWSLNGLALAMTLGTVIAVQLQWLRLARWMCSTALVVLLLIWPFFLAGVKTPSLVFLPVVLLTTGWIFGRKAMVILSAVAGLTIVAMGVMQNYGWILFPVVDRPVMTWTRTWAVLLALFSVPVWFLFRTFETMVTEDTELRRQLDAANASLQDELFLASESLEHADEQLGHVQGELERAYPMAVMASVVPGVAHDLNTPIGNTTLAVSAMRDKITEFELKVAAGSLRKSDLNLLLGSLSQGLDIVQRANTRAADMVRSLKELSIDQASQRRRNFDVATVIHEVVSVLTPSLKSGTVKVVVDVEVGLAMESYPGPLGQIVTNLLQNTIVHAFEGRASGVVAIGARQTNNNRLELTVHDDGVGMSPETCQRIFEPYFTTKLGSGGSGIGLALSYRLARDVLGGELTVVSVQEAGTTFFLTVPLLAPVVEVGLQ